MLAKIFWGFMLSVLIFNVLTWKYTNPYKLTMIFGKKGAGKTTLLVKLVYKHIKRGWTVYSTENIPGTRFVDYKDIGMYHFPDVSFVPFDPEDYRGLVRIFKQIRHWVFPYRPKVLLLIDEVGLVWNNRDYKNFKVEVRRWFKLQRHYYTKVYMFSQSFDVDKQLRDLTDQMYLIRNFMRVFSYGKRIIKRPDLKENHEDGSGNIVDDLRFDSILLFWLGSRMLTFIPRWSKLFNSFVIDPLPVREYRETPWDPELMDPTRPSKRHRRKKADDEDPHGAPSASDDELRGELSYDPSDDVSEPYSVPPDGDFMSDDIYIDDFVPEDFVEYPEYPGAQSARPPDRLKKTDPGSGLKSARGSGRSGKKNGSP